jgi:hypothetical protein
MLYVWNVHLTKSQAYSLENPIFSSEHKNCNHKGSVKKNSGRESQGSWQKDELIGGKPPVVK